MATDSQHSFAVHTYSQPTYCDACGSFLWGVVQQGMRCRRCGLDCHVGCVVHGVCGAKGAFSGDKMLGARPADPRPQTDARAVSLLDTLAAQTHITALSLEESRKDANPPLDLLRKTPLNTAAFVARITPLVDVFEFFVQILEWRDAPRTILALIVCLSICFYPVTLCLLPHCLILSLIASSRMERIKYEVALKNRNRAASDNAVGTTSIPPNKNSGLLQATYQSATYIRNLQFLQNQMGSFVKAFDAAAIGLRTFSQYCDQYPVPAIQLLLASSAGMLIVIQYAPMKLLAASTVLVVFASNTAVFQATTAAVLPWIIKSVADKTDIIREGIRAANTVPGGSVVLVTLWENQRWWAGLGWIPHLFQSERSPWSDETGAILRPHKDVFTLPESDEISGTWSWIDSEWALYFTWAAPDQMDQKEGWQYMDHFWNQPRQKPNTGSMTRRRGWKRRMQFVPSLATSAVSSLIPQVAASEKK
ncbi:integral peroxisomal membrane peroxin-domain-containing protein [Chytriomyces cf. hyalinus JEL632]|nr:integral peroxisomal membrane peroxin-domain-containing protein [Chytriomyces cf. hyalinus JEL632]